MPEPSPLSPPRYNPLAPTALIIGRFQPFHQGHVALALEALKVHDQVCFAIRAMPYGQSNPHHPIDIWPRIQLLMSTAGVAGHRFGHCIVPNVTEVVWGRDVGYGTREIRLPGDIERISATAIRKGCPR